MTKLSTAQTELLEAMMRGVDCIRMEQPIPDMPPPHYFRTDTHRRCTRTVEALLRKGMVVHVTSRLVAYLGDDA